MKIYLDDEQVATAVRLKNYLPLSGVGREVHGQGLVRRQQVVAFQPEAERIARLLKILGGWVLSDQLLVVDNVALALLIPVDGHLQFNEVFPHDHFRMLAEAVEIAAEQQAAQIAAAILDDQTDQQNSEPSITEASCAQSVDDVSVAASDEKFALQTARLNDLLEKTGVDIDAVKGQVVALSARNPSIAVLIEREDGSERPLTLPPTETLREAATQPEHKPREVVGVVVMIDADQSRVRLESGKMFQVSPGIEQLKLNTRYRFMTCGHYWTETITIVPAEMVDVLEATLFVEPLGE